MCMCVHIAAEFVIDNYAGLCAMCKIKRIFILNCNINIYIIFTNFSFNDRKT